MWLVTNILDLCCLLLFKTTTFSCIIITFPLSPVIPKNAFAICIFTDFNTIEQHIEVFFLFFFFHLEIVAVQTVDMCQQVVSESKTSFPQARRPDLALWGSLG